MYVTVSTHRILLVILGFLFLLVTQAGHHAYGHFFGAIRNVDKYQVVFLSYPSDPIAGNNSMLLNFSILESNNNIYNTYVAVTITEKRSGSIVDQLPYKFYEFSDITIPYTFPTPGDYLVTLQTRITGDEKYQVEPLVANFDVSVVEPNQSITPDELTLFLVITAGSAIASIVVYLHSRQKRAAGTI